MLTNINIWQDGICNKCGGVIIETIASNIDLDSNDPSAFFNDYANMCLNEKCEEHKWHFVGDMEELDYYKHKR